MNLFRSPVWNEEAREWSRPLDKRFLRVCATRKLLKAGKINEDRAIQLLAERYPKRDHKILPAVIAMWVSGEGR